MNNTISNVVHLVNPIVLGWTMCLGETLLPWKSKDKKCCLYETPYVESPIWVLSDVIAKFFSLRATSYRCTYKSKIFFGLRVTCFWRDMPCHIKTPTWNFYQEVYKQKWYQNGLLIALLEESRKEYIQVSLQADSILRRCHEQNASGTLKIKMTARKGRWAISPDSRASHPLRFLAVGYYSQLKVWCPLGLTSRWIPNGKGPLRNPLQRILLQGRSTLPYWMKCKEPTGTQSSVKSADEVVQKLSSDKQQSTLIHKFGNPLGIPCLSCTALT